MYSVVFVFCCVALGCVVFFVANVLVCGGSTVVGGAAFGSSVHAEYSGHWSGHQQPQDMSRCFVFRVVAVILAMCRR